MTTKLQEKYHWGFIGMSGIGKSHWTKQLSQIGFSTIDCDAEVIKEVSKQAQMPFSTLSEAGTWLQLPHQEGYENREALFMKCEKQVIEQLLDTKFNNLVNNNLEKHIENSRYIVDMGGSVIYTGDEVLAKLKNNLLLIFFDASEEVYEQMLASYFANPCPVLWKGQFKQQEGQSIADTFSSCYANLINYRRKMYLELADIVIPYNVHRQANWKAEDFLAWIESQI
jgi:shikimate kinase